MTMITLPYEDRHCGDLILVNRRYPLHQRALEKEEALDSQLTAADPAWPEILLARPAAIALQKAMADLGAEGGIVPVSGYRSRAQQEKIFRDSLEENGPEFTKKYVALPDRSEHQTGLAIDLGEGGVELDFIRPSFPDSGICGLFKKEAARYGFVLRYPQGQEPVTGIAHEPWHFRYVGCPHAAIMEAKGMVLEEYLEFLEGCSDGCFVWDDEDGSAQIRYIRGRENGIQIDVPEDCPYQVSGDNREGFIITVWRRR